MPFPCALPLGSAHGGEIPSPHDNAAALLVVLVNAHLENILPGIDACAAIACIGKESSNDDVEHMIFDCSGLEVERQKRQSLFASGRVALVDFLQQDQIELAAFVHGYYKACKG